MVITAVTVIVVVVVVIITVMVLMAMMDVVVIDDDNDLLTMTMPTAMSTVIPEWSLSNWTFEERTRQPPVLLLLLGFLWGAVPEVRNSLYIRGLGS